MRPIRSYSELRRLGTFEARFDYLELHGQVARSTFGFDRWMNQQFYTSRLWHLARDEVIVRDHGCDLGVRGHDIHVGLLVHHMNPMTMRDIENGEEWILNPEYLITTSHRTHNAIHYGNRNLLPRTVVARRPGDTTLWR
jgi:hypothetical protein